MGLSVIGAGSWGTALGHHLARRGHDVLVWAREPEVAKGIEHEHRNPLYQSDRALHPGLRASADLPRVAAHADTWLWVVPTQHSRGVMERLRPSMRETVALVSASKGIELSTLLRMDEMAGEALGLPTARFCALSGPTFAHEVLLGRPSAAVIASRDPELAARIQAQLSDVHLRLYRSRDVVGVELAGALKNVIAIAAGIVVGLGLGPNALAALTTRGLHEITRLAVKLGADPQTFRGLAGMGDLMLTCTFGLSRNRTVGERIGKGESVEEVLGGMTQVAEGVPTASAALSLARAHGVDMPITEAVTHLLSGEADARGMVAELMLRELKEEASL